MGCSSFDIKDVDGVLMGRSTLALLVETDEPRERWRRIGRGIHVTTGGRSPGCCLSYLALDSLSCVDVGAQGDWEISNKPRDGKRKG